MKTETHVHINRRDGLDTHLIFEQLKADNAAGRDYSERANYPSELLPLLDIFVQRTGIQPDKAVRSGWIKSLRRQDDRGLTPEDIERAIDKADYLAVRPGSLTESAIALKATGEKIKEKKNNHGFFAEWVDY